MLSSLPFLALLASPSAFASVRSVTATAQADNVLRENIRVVTTEPTRVTIRVWPTSGGTAAGWDTNLTTTAATDQTVTVWGLTAGIHYDYRVTVRPASGRAYAVHGRGGFTTAALPATLPRVSATAYTGSPDVDWVLFDNMLSGAERGVVMMADTSGAVVWYQTAPNAGEDVLNAWYDPDSESVFAILGGGHVMSWGLDGAVHVNWMLAAPLDSYPHHEVELVDGVLYMLTAREVTIDGRDLVEDGIEGYDLDGNLVYTWWANENGGLDTTVNAPATWELPGAGYWGDIFPTAADWLHANSLQVRDEADGPKAYISLRSLNQIVKVDVASGAVEWLMGDAGTTTADGNGDYAMDSGGISTRWWALQHHAHFEDDGLLYLFDNGSGSVPSRGLAVSVDDSTGLATIEREVDFSEFVRRGFNGVCASRGSTYATPADHLLLTCATRGFVADYDTSDTLTWALQVTGDRGVYRMTPVSPPGR